MLAAVLGLGLGSVQEALAARVAFDHAYLGTAVKQRRPDRNDTTSTQLEIAGQPDKLVSSSLYLPQRIVDRVLAA